VQVGALYGSLYIMRREGGIRALGVVPSFLASCFVAQTGVKIRRVITLKSDAEPADEDP
jgi:hypothetical protein